MKSYSDKQFARTITKEQIPEFLEYLHNLQAEMIEMAVDIKAQKGFTEARAIVKRYMINNIAGEQS